MFIIVVIDKSRVALDYIILRRVSISFFYHTHVHIWGGQNIWNNCDYHEVQNAVIHVNTGVPNKVRLNMKTLTSEKSSSKKASTVAWKRNYVTFKISLKLKMMH